MRQAVKFLGQCVLSQVTFGLMDQIEQLGNIFFCNAGERDTQICFADGDGADTVLVEQVNPQLLGIDPIQFKTHEIAGIEWIVAPGIGKTGIIQNLFDLERPALHDLKFLLLLGTEIWRFEGLNNSGL